MNGSKYHIGNLPAYLQDLFNDGLLQTTSVATPELKILTLEEISRLSELSQQYACLLLLRHTLTEQLASMKRGLYPPLILQRALVYEALGYADLAAADAFVACTLCETVRSDEWVSDLQPRNLDGKRWPAESLSNSNSDSDGSMLDVLKLEIKALAVLCRALVDLGAMADIDEKKDELVDRLKENQADEADGDDDEKINGLLEALLQPRFKITTHENQASNAGTVVSKFGVSRREIYPWNEHEPDRNSTASIAELNDMVHEVAPDLEARVSSLPALDGTGGVWHQLGLFAKKDIQSLTPILHEKSILTAIRPLDDALCDACGADLETVERDDMRQCPGIDCDLTFCSDDCADRARLGYHKPHLEDAEDQDEDEHGEEPNENSQNSDDDEHDDTTNDPESDYPPASTPFCGNTALQEIGRTTSSDTPEWDLYFLLLTRTIEMSTTQKMHPLDLPSVKYLWGDFSSDPFQEQRSTTTQDIKTPTTALPFSLNHNIALPLQYFEILMHSLPQTHTPYTPHWLAYYDFWVIQTLYAKFRGVANAQQSTFDGKPEMAAVHPCWCLANHSCAPNVKWSPTGVRTFVVRGGSGKNYAGEGGEEMSNGVGRERRSSDCDGNVDVDGGDGGGITFEGIREGDEIWSHYTDIRLDVTERRERLKEVLGGICRCVRCLNESGEM